jgi:hypothetical protein
MAEVQRLVQETLQKLGLAPEDMQRLEDELRRHLSNLGLPPEDDAPPAAQ